MKIFNIGDVLPQLPNLLFRDRMSFRFERLPFEVRKLGWRKKWNFVLAGLNQYLLPERPFGKPVFAQIEPANICNLKCPLCMSASLVPSRPRALLSEEHFRRVIDELSDSLLLIVLWNWGEPFLNPRLCEMIGYATSRNILVHTSTNGNVPFDDEFCERIIDSKLQSLVFAIDGATQETYSKYRAGGELERVKQNLRNLVAARKRRRVNHPMLTVRFVAMQPNEAELDAVRELSRELGADYFAVKSVDMPEARGQQLDQKFRPEEDGFRRYEYEKDSYQRARRAFECMRPHKRLTLDAQGVVVSCEYDYKNSYPFGNLSETASIVEIWKSQAAALFRRNFHRGHNQYSHCETCTYKNSRSDDCTLFAEPLHPERS